MPALTLMFLAALLPELLTGSTPVPVLILNPPGLFFLLALYGCGALLIREASVRWGKGWAAILPLGVAYGVVEEGLFAKTLIDPAHPLIGGNVGVYGRWLGLNWILVAALLLFHAVFSIALQILLTELIFPRTKGRPFLGRLGTTSALGAYVAIVIFGFLFNDPTYTPDLPVLAGLIASAGLLILVAYRLPVRILMPWRERPDRGPRWFEAEGVVFMAGFFALLALGTALIPIPAVVVVLFVALAAFTARFVFAHAGRQGNEAQKLAFAEGMILFFLPFDVVLEINGNLGVVMVPVAVLVLLQWLRRKRGTRTA